MRHITPVPDSGLIVHVLLSALKHPERAQRDNRTYEVHVFRPHAVKIRVSLPKLLGHMLHAGIPYATLPRALPGQVDQPEKEDSLQLTVQSRPSGHTATRSHSD
jgi:hypothetical protein